jgi:hypothetical protein
MRNQETFYREVRVLAGTERGAYCVRGWGDKQLSRVFKNMLKAGQIRSGQTGQTGQTDLSTKS